MLSTRAIRAEANGALQTCKSVAEVKAYGAVFGEKYGDSIWGCTTIYTHETFADLYNSHLQRVIENEEWEERLDGWSDRLNQCLSIETFKELESMLLNSRLKDDWMKVDELHAKGRELLHPDYLEEE